MTDWISFDIAEPKTAKRLLIKLKDGRELTAVRFHTELCFEGIGFQECWDLQMISTHWKYLKGTPK
jgi:hypothetical protein